MTPDDADRLVAFHSQLSAETVYLRFFAPYPELSEHDVHRFTHVDHDARVALVATVGGEIIGIGRYDRIDPAEAEVAFTVRDDHQGRGVGSVLLEHLAAAARERGIERFVAEVLPSNRRMLATFEEAGYVPSQHFEDGVVSLSFDIEPNDRSREVMFGREHRAEARSIESLLNPRSVAVVGASRTPGRLGHELLRHVRDAGFTGPVLRRPPRGRRDPGLPLPPAGRRRGGARRPRGGGGAGRAGARRRPGLRRRGGPRAGRRQRRLRRERARGQGASASPGRRRPRQRHAGGGPQRARPDQHRPSPLASTPRCRR